MKTAHDHIAPLTSIRGYGALWVVLGHFHYAVQQIDIIQIKSLIRYGMLGVDAFFVLSGLILSYIYTREFSDFYSLRKNIKNFLLLRLARIYPLHFVTLLLVVFLNFTGVDVQGGNNHFTLSDSERNNDSYNFFLSLFLMHGWGFVDGFSWNYPSWSISVEWLIYLLFPFTILFFSKLKNPYYSLAVIAGIVGYFFFTITDHNIFFTAYTWSNDPARGLALFIIGVCLNNLHSAKFLSKINWDYLLLGIIIFCTIGGLYKMAINYMILVVPAFIYGLLYIKGFMKLFFYNKPMVYIGEISYSLYLLHIPYGMVISHYFDITTGGLWGWKILVIIAGLIILSHLSYKYIETPCRIIVRNKIRGKK